MRYLIIISSFLLIALFVSNCGGGPGFSDTPEISFIGISKDTMRQGLNVDSLFLTIGFRDGDGDLGSKGQSQNRNIFLTDSRTDEIYRSFKVPELDIAGAQSGIEGEIIIKVFSDCCINLVDSIPCTPSEDFPTNDLVLEIQLLDDSGKESNLISTPNITLLCN